MNFKVTAKDAESFTNRSIRRHEESLQEMALRMVYEDVMIATSYGKYSCRISGTYITKPIKEILIEDGYCIMSAGKDYILRWESKNV